METTTKFTRICIICITFRSSTGVTNRRPRSANSLLNFELGMCIARGLMRSRPKSIAITTHRNRYPII